VSDGPAPRAEWLDALPLADLPDGGVAEVVVGDAVVALVRVGLAVHALDGVCSHQGGPLGRGKLEGCVLTCPWHGWQYDVATGRQRLSATIRQRVFATRVVGDTIQVRLTEDR
jgi:nitrite reductase (NADH) small subunit